MFSGRDIAGGGNAAPMLVTMLVVDLVLGLSERHCRN